MTYRFEHGPHSGAFYVRLAEDEYREPLPLAEPGFGTGVDVDAARHVLGIEFLSMHEVLVNSFFISRLTCH